MQTLNAEEYIYPAASEVKEILMDVIKDTPLSENRPLNMKGVECTQWNILNKNEYVQKLVEWIGEKIKEDFIPTPPEVKSSIDLRLAEIWSVTYGITADKKEDQSISIHNHTPSLFSFIYYVNVPEYSSPLLFPTSNVAVQVLEGNCIIFESRLDHAVPPNESEGRVCISGNFVLGESIGTYGYDEELSQSFP
tara:strand:- start:67 stop:645 length:579 start_codon:yes stop_codon:yes gene_type:complete